MLNIPASREEWKELIKEAVWELHREGLLPENGEVDDGDFLDLKGAAKLLHRSKTAVYTLVSRNEIPCAKRKGRLYFSRQALAKWIKEGERMTEKELNDEIRRHPPIRHPRPRSQQD